MCAARSPGPWAAPAKRLTGTWPTSCVALNDLAEAARGNPGNVGIYQRAYPDDAEAERACRVGSSRRSARDLRLGDPGPNVPEPRRNRSPRLRLRRSLTPPTEHPDYQRVRSAALARSGDADLATAVASDVIGRGAIDSFLRGTDAGVQYGQWNCPSRSAACPLAPEAATTPPPPPLEQGAQSQGPGTAPSIRLSDLVSRLDVSIWDGAEIDLSNLDADQTYEVLVSSSNPSVVGIGDCLGPSEWTAVTGSTSRIMWFAVRGCALGDATVTIEVRLAGASSAAASVSHHVTTFVVTSVPEFQRESLERAMQEVRDLLARGGPERPVQRPYPPRLTYRYAEQTPTTHTLYWATWWAMAPTGDVQITGFQMRYWPNYEPSKTTTVEFTDANAWRHRLTGLTPDTWYSVSMRACTNQDDCAAAEWKRPTQFKTPPG